MSESTQQHRGSGLYRLIHETRELFNVLAQASSDLNRVSGITPSMRAVMETLYPDTEMTVPAIARLQRVSRQHIQLIVKDLLAAELLDTHDNPAHKRSHLIRLSPNGVAQFRRVLTRERQLFQGLEGEFDEQQLAQAADGLRLVSEHFSSATCQAMVQYLSHR